MTSRKRSTTASKKSTSSQPTESGTADFVNGFAFALRQSSHKHVLVTPVDLGDREPALCGVRPPLGWVEDSTAHDEFYCHTCLVRFGNMYEDDDPRLTTADRQRWREISRELMND